MRPPLKVRARGRQLRCLQRKYDETTCPRTRTRVQMVLLAHEGYDVNEIAAITLQSDDSVRRWLHRFEHEGCMGLLAGTHLGRPPALSLRVRVFLRDCIAQSPHQFGFHRATWTTALLAQLVARRFKLDVSDECIRQTLHQMDIVCRRPTWTVKHLAQQQPGYAQKKLQSQGSYDIHRAGPMSTLKMKQN